MQLGTYTASSQAKLKPGVTLQGSGREGANKTKIVGTNFASSNFTVRQGHIVLVKNANGCTIKDIHFDGNARVNSGAISIENSENIVIQNVSVTDFSWAGIHIYKVTDFEISDFYIEDAAYESNAYSLGNLYLNEAQDGLIHDFLIYAHEALSGYGIKATTSLVNVDVYDGYLDLKKNAAWNGGKAGNIAIEYWDENDNTMLWVDNQIYNCFTNRNISMAYYLDNSTADYAVRVHDNTFYFC